MFRLLNIERRFIIRIHNPLDKILNNEAKIKILRFLCSKEAEWSGIQIAKEIKLNPVTKRFYNWVISKMGKSL